MIETVHIHFEYVLNIFRQIAVSFLKSQLSNKMEIEQVKCFFTIFLLVLFFALFGYESVLKER